MKLTEFIAGKRVALQPLLSSGKKYGIVGTIFGKSNEIIVRFDDGAIVKIDEKIAPYFYPDDRN